LLHRLKSNGASHGLRIFDHLLDNHGWNATGGILHPATHVTTDDHAKPATRFRGGTSRDREAVVLPD